MASLDFILEVHVPESLFTARIKRAIKLVMHDLVFGAERPIPHDFSLHIKELAYPNSLIVASEHEQFGAGFGVFTAESDAELITKIASGIQDHLIEFFMIAAPVFPGTQIPLAARVRETPTWEHLTDPTLFCCSIGKYPGL